jgi:hypothetical protein
MVYAPMMEFVPAGKGSIVRHGLGLILTPIGLGRHDMATRNESSQRTCLHDTRHRLDCYDYSRVSGLPVELLPDGKSKRLTERA